MRTSKQRVNRTQRKPNNKKSTDNAKISLTERMTTQPAPSNAKRSKVRNKSTWNFFGQVTLFGINVDFTVFLFLTTYEGWPIERRAAFGLAFLMRALFGGWFFFTVFRRPRQTTPLPDADVIANEAETSRMTRLFMLAQLINTALIGAAYWLMGQNDFILSLVYAFAYVVLLIIGFVKIYSWYVSKGSKKQVKPILNIVHQTSHAKALEKLNKLSEQEREELVKIMHRNEMTTHLNIASLFNILWGSVIVAFVLQVLQEIFRRL